MIKTTKIAIGMAGSVDSGKSTLNGVLSTGKLDNGNGSARETVAVHPHEIVSGQTSTVSTRHVIVSDYDAITLVDLCGHEKYFRTTTKGISSHFLDYAFLIVSANRGVLKMTKQHMRLLISLNIPILIIITHIDIVPEREYEKCKSSISEICHKFIGAKCLIEFVNHINDFNNHELPKIKNNAIDIMTKSLLNITEGKQNIISVVSMSNKTGFFLDTIINTMKNLVPRKFWSPTSKDIVINNKLVKSLINSLHTIKDGSCVKLLPQYKEFDSGIFYVDTVFNKDGIGLVVSGICRGKEINLGDILYIGPIDKEFYKVKIRSMHNGIKQITEKLQDHDRGCLNIVPLDGIKLVKQQISKGTILINSFETKSNVCYRIKAVISYFNKAVTIKNGNSPIITLGIIRQAVRMEIDPDENNGTKTDDGVFTISFNEKEVRCAIVTLKLKLKPEYVEPYDRFVISNGDIEGYGFVLSTISIDDDKDAKPDFIRKNKKRKIT